MALLHVQVVFILGIILRLNALQPQKGTKYYEDLAETEDCADRLPAMRCRYARLEHGCRSAKMRLNCARTCNACQLATRAPAPVRAENCQRTTFGCCWDGKTTQLDDNGSGCPPCEDNPLYAGLCKIWAMHCHNKTRIVYHEVVQEHCLRTCNICFAPIVKQEQNAEIARTLPPLDVHHVNNDNVPRRGAIYVWTKVLNAYKDSDI